MMLGEPVAKVLEIFPGEGMTPHELHAALTRCNFLWNALTFGTLVCDGFYIMAVPSLNIEAGGHMVLMDWRGCWDESVIYDPNRGREGKRFYSTKPGDGGIALRWWTEVVIVRPGGCLPQIHAR
jgi:hypothetical protein